MNLQKKVNKLTNFEKLHKIVDINRSISMIEIQSLVNKIKDKFEDFYFIKNLIDAIVDKYKIQPWLYKKDNLFKKSKSTLWIYISEEQKYVKAFYENIEENIKTKAKSGDKIIAIGKQAYEFAKNQNLEILFHLEDTKDWNYENSQKIITLMKNLIQHQEIKTVYFMLHSSRVKNFTATIFPMNQFYFDYDKENKFYKNVLKEIEEYTIFPNLETFTENLCNLYLEKVLDILILESSFVIMKNKLINENQILKDVEEKIKIFKREILKIKREMEIEEINIASYNKKWDYHEK
ncbi:hypothetical protein NV226_02950 [Mycoplasma iguanae]|uniref:ATP synthase gamma chain n=1 Tax=Mycoplasma iguanae TaxID=292461 RepID=A0ABY5RBD4_9MOLU|nr:hypothetical protein [Mycoplasma iguanae]UVD81657.1 hypothetical protein NV226_02950 [Mycoplasma iguanae]